MGLRLLAVDDHRESLDLIMAILVNAGADVRVSASAAEALRIVQDWRPHVLISDIEMPGEDGYAFIRKVRSLDPEGGEGSCRGSHGVRESRGSAPSNLGRFQYARCQTRRPQ